MRLDLFLKWSRVIPRRTLARDTCDAGRVSVNDEVARAGRSVKVGDVIRVAFVSREVALRVVSLPAHAPSKSAARDMIELIHARQTEDLDC